MTRTDEAWRHPAIPPIRLGLISTGLAVEKPHRPALRGLADRYVVTVFTDSSAEQSRRFAVPGADPIPLWRPRGSTGLPGQRISSSASFAA
jgi:hypothetical protein